MESVLAVKFRTEQKFLSNKGLEAMIAASIIAEENGIADMTLDEINAEIAEARKSVLD